MPTLEWIGKSKVINHHQDVPYEGRVKCIYIEIKTQNLIQSTAA